MAIFYRTAEVVRAGKNKPAQAQMSCIVALNKEMTTHFGSRRCALSLFQTAPLIETISKEMTHAHNFRKRPNQMYVIGIWGKSGQGKTAQGAEF